jgi:hypothetical protein
MIFLLLLLSFGSMDAQFVAMNDSFEIRKDTGSYFLNVLRNDSLPATGINTISSIFNASPGYLYTIVGDNVLLTDTSIINDTFEFSYVLKNSLRSDSSTASVSIRKYDILTNVFPGDMNSDSLVNHIDLLNLGVNYGRYGSPRRNNDANINFNSYVSPNWSNSIGIFNARLADANGNGEVDDTDFNGLQANYNKNRGVYLPLFSPPSSTVFLKALPLKSDTIYVDSSFGSTQWIQDVGIDAVNNQSMYGLGFSYNTVVYKNGILQTKEPKTTLKFNDSSWIGKKNSDMFYIDTFAKNFGKNEASIVNKKGFNSSGKGEMGIVEIVVEEVDIGKINFNDLVEVRIDFSQITYIDKNYNLIPISGKPQSVFIRNRSNASLQSLLKSSVRLHSNLIQESLIIYSDYTKNIQIQVFDAYGNKILEQEDIRNQAVFSTASWSHGIYFLTTSEGQVFKLLK